MNVNYVPGQVAGCWNEIVGGLGPWALGGHISWMWDHPAKQYAARLVVVGFATSSWVFISYCRYII